MEETNQRIPYGLRKDIDLRSELEQLDSIISELKVLYEQYFLGILPLAPDKKHQEVKATIRRLRKAPFKSSALAYRLRSIELRYNALHTYWQRVLREREDGTYFRDVFKADLREQKKKDEEYAATSKGKAEKGVESLFTTYQDAIERSTGRKAHLDFEAFKKGLKAQAKELRERHGIKKLSFRVVEKDGKVSIQAKAKKE